MAVSALVIPVSVSCSATTSNTTTNRLVELLNLVPSSAVGKEAPTNITLIDYASFYENAGITFTTPEEPLEKMTVHWKDVNLPEVQGSFITGYGPYAEHATIRKQYLGYDMTSIDAETQFGTPPADGVAAIGRFDPEATKKALSNQEEWPPEIKNAYTTEEYNGVIIHSWGDGFKINLKTRLVPPHVDPLGRARPLAVMDTYLFYHTSPESLKLMIDASQQKRQSLADLPEYSSIANELAGQKIYAAIMGDDRMANLCLSSIENDSRLTEKDKATAIDKMGTPLKKFLTFGSGSGKDEKGTYAAIIIYHENSDTANENVALLKQRLESNTSLFFDKPWREIMTEADIKAERNILLARLYGVSRGFWPSWIYSQDSLLYHE